MVDELLVDGLACDVDKVTFLLDDLAVLHGDGSLGYFQRVA